MHESLLMGSKDTLQAIHAAYLCLNDCTCTSTSCDHFLFTFWQWHLASTVATALAVEKGFGTAVLASANLLLT